MKLKVSYALPAFAMAVVGIPIYIYIPKFYTDYIGLDIALVGIILLAVRMFDAVTDPVMGVLSDRTVTRFGRRRPFIGTGALFLCISIVLLFNPPEWSVAALTWWFLVCLGAVFIFWTITVVPYESLGPELTFDYDERTSLFGIRDGSLIAGTMVAAIVPVILRSVLGRYGAPFSDRTVFFLMSALYVPLILICCYICIRVVKEPALYSKRSVHNLRESLAITLKNKPFVILILAFCFSSVAAQLPAALILYYVEYVLKSSSAEVFLLIYFISGVAFLPAWIYLSGRIGKKSAWMISMVINTGAFFNVFWLGAGDEVWYGILVFFSGIGFGAGLALPSSIAADVIDYDEVLSGNRREGHYVGMFSVVKKMSGALGAGVGLWVLGLSGYSPNTDQNPDVLISLRVLYALVPCLLSVLGLIIAWFYPLSKTMHESVLETIDNYQVSEAVTGRR